MPSFQSAASVLSPVVSVDLTPTPGIKQTTATDKDQPFKSIGAAREQSSQNRKRDLLEAAAFAGVALASHRFSAVKPLAGDLVPRDWKVWARVFLGIGALHKLNEGMNWKPAPWLGGAEAVAVITPLAMLFNKKTLTQTLIMMPLVAGIVQGANEIYKRVNPPLESKFSIPPVITGLGLSALITGASLSAYRYMGISAAAAIGCVRGCSPGSIVCLSELGELMGGMLNWLKPGSSNPQPEKPTPLPQPSKAANVFLAATRPTNGGHLS